MFDNFNKVKNQNILVIGDIILDKYIHGSISRMSPEAPVPVVLSHDESYVLGGAANVAANLISLGANAFLIGAIGKDRNGTKVLELADNLLGNNSRIFQSSKKTTTKTRVVSKGKQLLRIDDEDISKMNQAESATLLESIEKRIKSTDEPARDYLDAKVKLAELKKNFEGLKTT